MTTLLASPAPIGAPSRPVATASLGSLTGLRWVAATAVFVYHLRNMQYFDGPAQTLLSVFSGAGSTAVSLFFILSGFVLAYSYRPTGIGRYYLRRFARVYPLHLVGVALAVCVGATVFPAIRTTDPRSFVANLLLVNSWWSPWWQTGNPVSWSLACEVFFYLCAPFLIRVIAARGVTVTRTILALSLAATWVAPVVALAAPGISPYSFPPVRLVEFIAGIAAACLVRGHGWRLRGLILPLSATLGGYIAASFLGETPFGAASATSLGFVLLVVALATADLDGRGSWLSSSLLQKLGAASFAFYLVHLLVLQCVLGFLTPERTDAGALGAAVLAFAAASALAVVLHRGVEGPVHALLTRRR
ncbi:acyltransferase [Microbacterium sp. BG28]|uniref:acyltransferase family protein n=1 Tax=Microbacterium sp. BG28 TaxID=3097356 RepID=UPI002A5ABB85|nr:acyltransferase [Microbacterium sp. BG28]MDY0828095.1 acyltransferase [Microbacterium sp. BG28]